MTNETPTIKRSTAVAKIKSSGGKIFSVRVKKRTGNKEVTRIVARLGVKKYLTEGGTTRSFNPAGLQLIPVYAMDRRGYRHVAIEGIQEVTIGGQRYLVKD